MRPYTTVRGAELYLCTQEELAQHLLAMGVLADMLHADPPYQSTAHPWDRWPAGWPGAVARVLKPTGSMWCHGTARMFWQRHHEFEPHWELMDDAVWRKQNGTGPCPGRLLRVHESPWRFRLRGAPASQVYSHEPALQGVGVPKSARRRAQPAHLGAMGASAYESDGTRRVTSVLDVPNLHGHGPANETQKPVGLLRPLVENACPPGGVLVDFFAGNCSAGVAAMSLNLGIRYYACDIRESQLEAGARALERGEEPRRLSAAAGWEGLPLAGAS